MNARLLKTSVCVSLLTASGFAAGWGCPAVVDPIWQGGIAAAATSMTGAVAAMVESVSTSRVLNAMRLQAAFKILAQQVSSTTDKQISVDLGAKQGMASVLTELSQRKAVHNTMMDFNAATGQGFDPCGETSRSQTEIGKSVV